MTLCVLADFLEALANLFPTTWGKYNQIVTSFPWKNIEVLRSGEGMVRYFDNELPFRSSFPQSI